MTQIVGQLLPYADDLATGMLAECDSTLGETGDSANEYKNGDEDRFQKGHDAFSPPYISVSHVGMESFTAGAGVNAPRLLLDMRCRFSRR